MQVRAFERYIPLSNTKHILAMLSEVVPMNAINHHILPTEQKKRSSLIRDFAFAFFEAHLLLTRVD